MALEITDGNFEDLVLRSTQPVLVDFWAVWCGPCRMLAPVVEEISKEYEGRVVVGKVDVDNNQEFAAKYGIRNIPTVLVFQNGEVVGRQVGVAPKNKYNKMLLLFLVVFFFVLSSLRLKRFSYFLRKRFKLFISKFYFVLEGHFLHLADRNEVYVYVRHFKTYNCYAYTLARYYLFKSFGYTF